GRHPPLALGVEAAGVIDAVGEQVTTLARGDGVLTHPLPLRQQGAWAEWLVAPAALVARKPDAVPWETAAAFPVPALTADQALSEAVPALERRNRARARRRWCDGRTRSATRDHARGSRCCDSRPRQCGAHPRLWRDCGLRPC